jgi:hypothetical protein
MGVPDALVAGVVGWPNVLRVVRSTVGRVRPVLCVVRRPGACRVNTRGVTRPADRNPASPWNPRLAAVFARATGRSSRRGWLADLGHRRGRRDLVIWARGRRGLIAALHWTDRWGYGARQRRCRPERQPRCVQRAALGQCLVWLAGRPCIRPCHLHQHVWCERNRARDACLRRGERRNAWRFGRHHSACPSRTDRFVDRRRGQAARRVRRRTAATLRPQRVRG